MRNVLCLIFFFFVHSQIGLAQAGVGKKYPLDKVIEGNREIVFTEDFEEASLADVIARWDDCVNTNGMSLVNEVSPVSPGVQSLQMTSIIGQNTGGHLYKMLPQGYDTLYARFYVKFAPSCHSVHHFVHMGGYNPPTPWPQGGAGVRPDGDDRFTSGIEPLGDEWRWDFYTYWMHMRGNPGDTFYWGNTFNPTPPVPVEIGEWICVEVMMKCNDPLTSYNGEQAFWINGELAIHLGEGFPNGYWVWDHFHPDPDSAPFEGFQWRIVDELKINFFWLLFYMTQGYPGQIDTVWFDDIVVATEYTGPIASISEQNDCALTRFEISPNPSYSNTDINFSLTKTGFVRLNIYDPSGRLVRQLINKSMTPGNHFVKWNCLDLNNDKVGSGVYFCNFDIGGVKQNKKVLVLE